MRPAADSGARSELAGRYRLLDRIGAGGMGSVWDAEDLRLGRRVAVKLPSDAAVRDPLQLRRFDREARAAARVSHPNVAAVLDYGHDGERPFMVLELLDGETLAARLRRGPIPTDEVVGIADGVAAALDAAHAVGVVHRDVKPGNVMLTGTGVKVMDFGIAVAGWAPTITTTGVVGTAAYLSPEQAAGEAAGPASDVYSLAVVVYEMLAGRPPFVDESPVAVVAAHAHRDPPSLRELAPEVPGHVADAVDAALVKDPTLRPATASAFARSLRQPAAAETTILTTPEPTQLLAPAATPAPRPARPPRLPAEARRWAWAAAAVLALVVVALLAAYEGDGLDEPPARPVTETTVAAATVPDVVGRPLQEATVALQAAGLVVGDVVPAEGAPDTVIGMDPAPGASVPSGTTVTLTVGDGSEGGPAEDGDDDGGDDEEEEEGGPGNGNGPRSCDSRPDHPSCD
jgi:hypothetical protein